MSAIDTLRSLLTAAARRASWAEEAARHADLGGRGTPYAPAFFLELDLEAAGLDREGDVYGEYRTFAFSWEGGEITFRAGEDFGWTADLLCRELSEDEAGLLLSADCWRWYGDDGHSGDCADRTLHRLGSAGLDAALLEEVESWRQASAENHWECQWRLSEGSGE